MTTQVRRPARVRAATLGLAVLATAGLVGACADDGDLRNTSDEPTAASTTATPTASESAGESPSESASESLTPTPSSSSATPTPSPTQTVTPAPQLTAALLPAGEITGLNDQWRWREGETRTAEPASGQLADCVRFSLAAIGASEAVTRSHLPPAHAADARASAFQVVARFPDEQTAVRVMQVLRSWHESCQRRLNQVSDQSHRVSEAESIGAGADAFAYLHSAPGSTPDTTQFEDVGQVRVGRLISLVVVRLDEQDYNYDARRTPAARTLSAAAKRLG
jgi:hypothetical protein